MLPIQSVLYENEPIRNVTIRKCTIRNVTDPLNRPLNIYVFKILLGRNLFSFKTLTVPHSANIK